MDVILGEPAGEAGVTGAEMFVYVGGFYDTAIREVQVHVKRSVVGSAVSVTLTVSLTCRLWEPTS